MRNESEWKLSEKLHAFLCDHVYSVKYADWEMREIRDKARQATHGDLEFIRGKHAAYVDEKAYSSVWDGCLVEVIQDVETKDLGWLFTLDSCTHLICGYYESRDAEDPQIVYKMPWPELREKYWTLCEKKGLWHKGTGNGYGKTIFTKIPWPDVPGLEILYSSGDTVGKKCSCCGVSHTGKWSGDRCELCSAAEAGWQE